ncbi:MAG: cysteine desulfurase [Lachnospiraceae bacterium]|nr:cysteine desulfurase [Lachnospiraceae bacterium]
MEVYLDNAATTKLNEEAFSVMQKVFFSDYGNPSSLHIKGVDASAYLREARRIISEDLKCAEKEIVFTSGGTESNNTALFGTAHAKRRKGMHIISSAYEHASVYNPLIALEEEGFKVDYVKPDANGIVDPKSVAELVNNETILVSIMAVNNEIGAVNDIGAISKAVKEVNPDVTVHVDAIQAYPKYRIIPKKEGIDLMSVSSHKFGGPKGVGFLYIKDKTRINPLILGGGQQKGMRSGTDNVPGIAGMAEALKVYAENRKEYVDKMYALKEHFAQALLKVEGIKLNAVFENLSDEKSLGERIRMTAPHVLSVSFPNVRSEVMLHALEMKGICCSSGSACSSNHPAISGTLQAIGVEGKYLDTTLRFSLSPDNTQEEIDYTVEAIKELLPVYLNFYRK